jgi:hypothetical protein
MQKIDIDIKPSKLLMTFIFSLLCADCEAILYSPLLIWAKGLLIFFAIGYGIHIVWKDILLRADKSILGIRSLNNGTWMLFTKNKILTGEVSGDSTVTGFVIILRFIIPGSGYPYSCILFRHTLDAAVYRNILIQLRCQQKQM